MSRCDAILRIGLIFYFCSVRGTHDVHMNADVGVWV